MSARPPLRRHAWIAIAAILAGGALLWWLRTGPLEEGPPAAAEPVTEVPGRPGGAARGVGGPGAGEEDHRRTGQGPVEARGPRVMPGQVSAREMYERQAVYPPGSRPLTYESHSDLIEWNRRAEYATPTGDDPDVTYLFSADRYFVIGEQPIEAYLDVRRDGQPIQAVVLSSTARVIVDGGASLPSASRVVSLDYRWDGQRQVTVLDPRAFGRIERTVQIRVDIEFEYRGPRSQTSFINFIYTPAGAVPGRFTGRFREAVEGGSLVLYAGVEIYRDGWFNIDCNLWDADDEPVAWTRFKGSLGRESTEVALSFFGKVLVDSGSSSPWRIGELRGLRFDEESSPAEQMMVPFEGRYSTRRYSLDSFSDEPYVDPRHELFVRAFEEEAAAGVGVTTPRQSLETMPEPSLRELPVAP